MLKKLIFAMIGFFVENRLVFRIFYYFIYKPFKKPLFLPPGNIISGRINLKISGALTEIGKRKAAYEILHSLRIRLRDDISFREQVGVSAFLASDISNAEKEFSALSTLIESKQKLQKYETEYRLLDKSWTLAIGHIANLGIYFKAIELGWIDKKTSLIVLSKDDTGNFPDGWPILRLFFSKGLKVVMPGEDLSLPLEIGLTEKDQDAKFPHATETIVNTKWLDRRRGQIKLVVDDLFESISHSFWYGRTPDDGVKLFGPYGVAVNSEWARKKLSPIVKYSEEEKAQFRDDIKHTFGIPQDAWYVLVHVREAGYHQAWHNKNPGTRNAKIGTYNRVFEFITEQGGYVIRAGDATMKPLEPQDRVIDYASSPFKTPELDILLCSECKYFIGTNSGYSLVPSLFGVRSLLTNWSPMAIPNWNIDDIVVPKKVWDRYRKRYCTAEEMMESVGGWSQWQRDFSFSRYKIVDNSPTELLRSTEEIHRQVFSSGGVKYSKSEREMIKNFRNIIEAHGGYNGSQISVNFLLDNPEFLNRK